MKLLVRKSKYKWELCIPPESAGVRTAAPIVIQEPKRAKNNIK